MANPFHEILAAVTDGNAPVHVIISCPAEVQQLVVALQWNTSVKSVDLRGNEIGDAGAQALAQNATLQTLNLECNGMGAPGAQA